MIKKKLMSFIEKVKNKFGLLLFGYFKVPLIAFVKPRILELSETKTVIKVPLNRRTKNHLGSMYFGALATAADVTAGLVAMKHIRDSGKNIHLSFKDFNANFLKRAEGDTFFSNDQGGEIRRFVEEVIKTGERRNLAIQVVATVPDKFSDEPVAIFNLTLSLKLLR